MKTADLAVQVFVSGPWIQLVKVACLEVLGATSLLAMEMAWAPPSESPEIGRTEHRTRRGPHVGARLQTSSS